MAEIDGNKVIRSYTPTTLDNDKGHFDLVVKVSAAFWREASPEQPESRPLAVLRAGRGGPADLETGGLGIRGRVLIRPPQTYEKGNISRYLSLLTIGQEVKVKGPKGKFHYQ
jgi:cytochrome-b5 reductase